MILSFNLYWAVLIDLSRASQRSSDVLAPENKKNELDKISEIDLDIPNKENKDARCECITKKEGPRPNYCKLMNEKRLEILRFLKDTDYTKDEIRSFLLEFSRRIRNQMPKSDNLIPNSLDLVYRKMFIGNFKFSCMQNLFLNDIVFQNPSDDYVSYNIVFDHFKIKLKQFLRSEHNENISHLYNKIQNIFEYINFLLDLLIVDENSKSPDSSLKTGTKTYFTLNLNLQPAIKENLDRITSHMHCTLNDYQIEYDCMEPLFKSTLVEILALFNIIKSRTLDIFRIFESLEVDIQNEKILNLKLDIFTDILVYLDLSSDLAEKSKKSCLKNKGCVF